MALRYEHLEAVEKHAGKLAALIAIMIALGGLAEITPIFVTAHAVRPECRRADRTTRCGLPARTSTFAKPAISVIRR